MIVGLHPGFTARPAGGNADAAGRVAPRPATLDGARLALVINRLGNSERFADLLEAELRDRVMLAEVIRVVKAGISVPPDPDQSALLRDRATAAITLFGGCGSCSTRSFRDAVELEWTGIPSVALIAEAVSPGVRAIARLSGMAEYPFVEVGRQFHNKCGWTDTEARAVAALIAPKIIRSLTEPSA